ncbi:reduced coenzyme F420:NADP oxidoreductase [Methanothermus fervidus DSM 2088]|uniref:Reduced coenzyme F420:NADP oxidoreductase n=1 Tax=Methanothermus fervidus (strain ATCC 43054 / DSM 2088 / JCM 10308 / V24 S) TaxID=523846 RepID=E3GWR0_METFV|nr:NADPH-dependent F420 reductase [Methanothermus fervidus]ADP77979.1 reduced coenzyme F420:NADP oxidoreductase [Methanothermus fervidus DSM 2088]
MKIAIIGGTGDQGFGLALRLAKAGEKIIIGSRSRERAKKACSKILNIVENADIEGMENKEAAKEADIVILTVPLHAQLTTIENIKDVLDGKILVDATVPLESSIGGSGGKYVELWDGSAAERTSRVLKDKNVKIVTAFNNISAHSLQDIENDVECDCLVAGDDENAKKIVMELAEKIPGVRAIDCGPLENSKIIEKITPLLITLNIRNNINNAGIRITGLKKWK